MSRWLGTWRLVPELCHGEGALPPRTGTLRIAREDGDLRIAWQGEEADGTVRETAFAAPADGTPRESAAGDVDTYAVRAESDAVLTGEALHEGRRVGWSARRVSGDGRLMSAVQGRDFADGPRDILFLVYRREVGDG